MKNTCIGIVLLGFLLLTSCKKDHALETPDLAGIYTGKTDARSSRLEEVFTSPTESHWEWKNDSITIQPDTLQILAISSDSFELQGSVAQRIPVKWHRFAFSEGGEKSPLVFERSESLPGYYSNTFLLQIDTETHSITGDYHSEQTTPSGTTQVRFEGIR